MSVGVVRNFLPKSVELCVISLPRSVGVAFYFFTQVSLSGAPFLHPGKIQKSCHFMHCFFTPLVINVLILALKSNPNFSIFSLMNYCNTFSFNSRLFMSDLSRNEFDRHLLLPWSTRGILPDSVPCLRHAPFTSHHRRMGKYVLDNRVGCALSQENIYFHLSVQYSFVVYGKRVSVGLVSLLSVNGWPRIGSLLSCRS